jgi:preprotein translocase subunit SecD
VTALARTEFFGGGHRFSGFSAKQLGRVTSYAGRGRVRPPAEASAEEGAGSGAGAAPGGRRQSIAARRAAELAAKQSPDGEPGDPGGPGGSGGSGGSSGTGTDRVPAGGSTRNRRDA